MIKLTETSTRDKRQIESVNEWIESGYNGIIKAYTGFGKTRGIALRAIYHARPKSILVSVPSFLLKNDWEELLSTMNIPHEVVIVNTLIKHTYDVDLFIIDEIHRTGAETFIKTFDCVEKNKFLGLTASLERADGRHELITQHASVIDEISLKEGLDSKWVDPFEVIKIPIELTKAEQINLDKINKRYEEVVEKLPGKNPMKAAKLWIAYLDQSKWVVGKQTKKVYFKTTLINTLLTSKGVPRADTSRIIAKYFDKPGTDHAYFQHALLGKEFYRLVNKRKTLLYNAHNKVPRALELIEQYANEPKFVLSREIKFIEKLMDKLDPDTARLYHSKLTPKERKENLALFMADDNDIDTLLSVKALNEGTDVPKLSTLIVTSYTASQIDKIQIFGRALRKFKNKKVTIMYFYVPGTQEETWLNNIL